MSYSYAIVSVDTPESFTVERVDETDRDRPLILHVKDGGRTLAIIHLSDKAGCGLIDGLIEKVRDYAPF